MAEQVALLTPKTEFDSQVALLAPKTELTAQVALLTPKTEHESLLDRVAASELTNTALISQLQDAVEILSVSVLHHRAAFDSLAERQLANVNRTTVVCCSEAISLLAT